MMIIPILFWMVAMWCLVAALATLPTWLLWNWLMPDIFGLGEISLAQAFGLLLLFSFLFGSRGRLMIETE